MKKFIFSLISIWFCLGTTILSQNPEWITYNTSNSGLPDSSVTSIAIDGSGNKWIGVAWSGLAKFEGTNWTVYNEFNSGLHSSVEYIAIDGSGNKWIGTLGGGLAKFDDTSWTVYNTSNSDLPSNEVGPIAIDGSGNKWIGVGGFGLAKFDGTNPGGTSWTVYNNSNSGLPSNYVHSIAIDGSGNKWIGTWDGGLVKFDDINPVGASWTVYNTSNSGLPDNSVNSIAIDGIGNKWIGTGNGLAKFHDTNPGGVNWTIYNTSNSGLPHNWVSSLAIDGSGNMWIGTGGWIPEHSWGGGLAVFKEGGIVPVELNSFTATDNGKEVTLNWSTATELNNQGFEVQRKFGANDFVTIGSVKGNGTTTTPNHYSFIDKLIDGGKYSYRLKQIDYDGSFEYSNVIEVDVRLLDKFTLEQNYPNPFNPTTKISWQSPVSSLQVLKVFDILGNEIKTLVNEEKEAGYHSIDFDGSNLPSGVYFYHLQAGNYIETKKMILLR